MKSTEQPRLTISPFLVLVLIHSMQFGPEYLAMSIKPIQLAGQDAWVSVVLWGLIFHVIIWMMYQILNHNETDLVHIHQHFFGKLVGGALNFGFIIYFLLVASYLIRQFIEIIQVWLFPDLVTWTLALALLMLVYYIVAGGFRVIVGICMVSLVRYVTIFALFFPVAYFHFNNLTPIFDHSVIDIIQAGKEMTFPYLGVESLFFCYTFIESPKKSQKWAHIANVLSTVSYLLIIIFALLMFKPEQLSKEIWPQLTKYKFIHFPFIERFEYIGAVAQILWVIPIICFGLWAASRMCKLMFTVKQLTALPILLVLVFTIVCLIPNHTRISSVQSMLSGIGFYIVLVYIPFLYIVDMVRMKVRRTV
ncbi:GerAB/ArcD/ProY family transporter [Paenibacillus qinlingensis]|uniref:Spore germination protein (Amino acid permease) n=1 Tax=Paenibacillus qinlingensis TaxID=1837343 RepID=A0ABU1NS78_9BACL|nr:GerAB/ArcD/ProY family transporter [Paenibacillus qinlingensis]MDR6550283.1 spore germination protein (amino acid permease) [Paenibacillus qinlingensis]